MFQISPIFSVPFVQASMPDCEAMNAELRELFLARVSEGDRYRNPDPFTHRNAELFESNFRLFDWPQPCVRKLRDFCFAALYRCVGELNGYDHETLRRLHVANEAWFHVTRKHGYFGPHNHPLHSWSGVYCVSHAGDDPASDSGKLTFISPFAMNTMFVDTANIGFRGTYHMSNRMIRLKAGELVLFPSWLLHQVLPYEGDDVRITVAFNVRFQLHGAQPADVPIG